MVLFIFKYVEYYLKCVFNIRFFLNIITFNDKFKVDEKMKEIKPEAIENILFFNKILYFWFLPPTVHM